MHKDIFTYQSSINFVLFIFFLIAWIIIQLFYTKNNDIVQLFTATYGLVALFGGIFGLFVSQKWGGIKSIAGKALIMFSLGLFAQEFGQIVYSYYYYILHTSNPPYPSLGDLGFFGSIPLYSYGVILLGRAAGAQFRFKSMKRVIPSTIIIVGMLSVSYILFLQGYKFDWSNPIKVFLDFGYPLGEAIYISLAVSVYLLSSGVLGGIMKSKILLILFALCIQFAADYTFLYQSSNNTWVAGGTNDLTYLIAYFVMTYSLLQWDGVVNKFRYKD